MIWKWGNNFCHFFLLFIYCKAGRVTCPDGIVAPQMRKGFLCLCARCSFYCRPTILLLGEGSARSTFRIETGIGVARYLVALDVGTRERALLHWGNVTENNFSILGKVGDDKENDTAFHLTGHGWKHGLFVPVVVLVEIIRYNVTDAVQLCSLDFVL